MVIITKVDIKTDKKVGLVKCIGNKIINILKVIGRMAKLYNSK
jgi:GTPase